MKKITILFNCVIISVLAITSCKAQTTKSQSQDTFSNNQTEIVGGGCETCEYMYLGQPKEIKSVSYSPAWTEKAQKLLVTGTIFRRDGKTPAPNVIIYYWQTDSKGVYSSKEDMTPGTKRHGYIRGWAKTDTNGKYSIYTIHPAPYPNNFEPEHIHMVVKEPNIANEYYIDELVFDADKLLLPMMKKRPPENRGGSGVMRLYQKGDLQIAERNIILGLNIPAYPKKNSDGEQSGLNVGEDQPSFTPYHAWGADKGTRACPVCKYGKFLGVIYFVGNNPDWNEIKKWLAFSEQESIKRGKFLKIYFVYGNEEKYDKGEREKELAELGAKLDLKNVALTFVPSLNDTESKINLNQLNQNAENTFIIFRRSNIIAKFINLKATTENFATVSNTLDKFTSVYFGD